jgi:hypothetical protein
VVARLAEDASRLVDSTPASSAGRLARDRLPSQVNLEGPADQRRSERQVAGHVEQRPPTHDL